MQDKTALFVLIPEYADWEPALLAAGLRWGFGLWSNPYAVKTVSLTKEPVPSIGGFSITPDYSFDDAPEKFAALILVGGTAWHKPDAKKVIPLVRRALAQKAVLGAICDASVFLAVHGFLNRLSHTFIDQSVLSGEAKGEYSGEAYFENKQSVCCGNIITAKPTGYVEFATDVLSALQVSDENKINSFYQICKTGDCSILLNHD
ncbi:MULTISPECIES: DJ-1/PfpI family protein [unclassified Desulfovibrio]|uniref:DJ-1/PfpI family protein n=1 Tax=unclassified Desulfovibrio TaxID=2593640 RepID=UPI002FDA529C